MEHASKPNDRYDRVAAAEERLRRSVVQVHWAEALLEEAQECVVRSRLRLEDAKLWKTLDPHTGDDPMDAK